MIPIPSYPFLIFLVFTVGFAGGQLCSAYTPEKDTAIDCGSEVIKVAPDQRKWDGDVNSELFPIKFGKNSESLRTPLDGGSTLNGIVPVPYETARLSLSEFTYTIAVTAGPKFVRLHFYSDTYAKFNISKAFFSVKVDKYILLSNFSVSLNAEFLRKKIVVKEYYINVESSNSMSIKFTPSNTISEAFALINGIEVVPLPVDLYNSDPEHGLRLLEEKGVFPFKNDTAMETVYRINVGGGSSIPPNRDTGFFRAWEYDGPYLTKPGYSLMPVETSAVLKFSKVKNYTAPPEVYRTARTIGIGNRELIKAYKLTWEYPVDSQFHYRVRLHFCEIVFEMNKTGDRLFSIFITNEIAEEKADVIKWAEGKYTPYVRDYLVPMYNNTGKKRLNLSIALQANQMDWQSTYVDGILNGVEIFKMSRSNNLAGTNPDPIKSTNDSHPRENVKSNRLIIVIVSGVISILVIVSVLAFFVVRQGRKIKDSAFSEGITRWGPNDFGRIKSSKSRGSSSLPSDRCRYFSLAEIIAATNNFEETFIIGVGGFGNVYKGYIDNETMPVAIKRLKSESSQGIQEFKTEIELLSHLRHRHLVSLIGYCNEDREMILVYDYMAHGTLRDHLYKTENPPLTWKQRLEICMGAANGLHYLHTGTKYTIIHRDVKTTNILLDEKWVAKVSDFGLSKTGPTSMSKGHLTTVVKGSVGYLDPEYYRRQQLTEKSDVYSFGVVLCEVLCGRPPIVRTAEKGQVSLAEWVQSCYHNGRLTEIIDPYLTGKIAPECLKKYGELTVQCMLDNGTERPSMKDIVWGLEFAMQLQNNAEGNDSVGGKIMKTMSVEEVSLLKNYSNDSDGAFTSSWADTTESKSNTVTKIISSSEQGSTTDDSRKGMSGTVFSEITDYPNGR